ncbi:unnamed protein product, partial [Gulo gulo]
LFPSLGTAATRGEKHQPNPKAFARRENKLECSSSSSTSSPGGIEMTGEKWKEGLKRFMSRKQDSSLK